MSRAGTPESAKVASSDEVDPSGVVGQSVIDKPIYLGFNPYSGERFLATFDESGRQWSWGYDKGRLTMCLIDSLHQQQHFGTADAVKAAGLLNIDLTYLFTA